MIKDLLAAMAVGLSFGNLWVCVLLVLALEKTSRLTALGFLSGRTLAVLLLSLTLSLLGPRLQIENRFLNIISGALILLFAFYLALLHVFNIVPPWKKKRKAHSHTNCDSNCSDCTVASHPAYKELCDNCSDRGVCLAEEHNPDFPALKETGKKKSFFLKKLFSRYELLYGFVMGSLRGAALCAKLLLLAPVLLKSGAGRALAVGAVFALASSIYPLAGFMAGSFALKLVKFKRILFTVSCLILTLIGIHYIILGILALTGR